jgi:S1-C subfamily serine protease
VKLTLGEQPDDLVASRDRGGNDGGDAEDTASGKTKIGATLGDLNDEMADRFGIEKGVKGAVVRDVDPRSPAARAGLRPGDVITDISKQPVSNAKEAREALNKADLKKGVTLYVVNRNGSQFVRITSDK